MQTSPHNQGSLDPDGVVVQFEDMLWPTAETPMFIATTAGSATHASTRRRGSLAATRGINSFHSINSNNSNNSNATTSANINDGFGPQHRPENTANQYTGVMASSHSLFSTTDDVMHNSGAMTLFPGFNESSVFADIEAFDPKLDAFSELVMDLSSLTALQPPSESTSNTGNIATIPGDVASLLIPDIQATSSNSDRMQTTINEPTGCLATSSLSSLFSYTASSRTPPWSLVPLHPSSATTPSSMFTSSSSSAKWPCVRETAGSNDNGTSSGGTVASGLYDKSLARAVDLLRSLCISDLVVDSASAPTQGGDAPTRYIIQENHRTIDAIGSILSSSCVEDGFSLAVLAMVVLKIFERYDAVARMSSAEATSNTGMSSGPVHTRTRSMGGIQSAHSVIQSPLGGTNADPSSYKRHQHHHKHCYDTITAKLVLGELHRMQRLINELSHEFHKYQEDGGLQVEWSGANGGGGLGPRGSSDEAKSGTDTGTWSPQRQLVALETLAQLERDMRRCLKTLSAGIINYLRRR
ncbi:aflr [Grosmannia clavigera kw1407]|uniref:Aflr n=1 Tax=Grosmannia clavigera (strain kw1407 / UAMH 11150) TaxID=655863 RepID=F0XGI7_GROCL|nr:aflr [Grosmannia clavigera kw1407]EFX02785.1 aflr [Grosmannia clavigera kw1407]